MKENYKLDQTPIVSKFKKNIPVTASINRLGKHSKCTCDSGRRYKNCCKVYKGFAKGVKHTAAV